MKRQKTQPERVNKDGKNDIIARFCGAGNDHIVRAVGRRRCKMGGRSRVHVFVVAGDAGKRGKLETGEKQINRNALKSGNSVRAHGKTNVIAL